MEINTELNPTPHSERNHGIELLRIFAMLLAAVLHILKKAALSLPPRGTLLHIRQFGCWKPPHTAP